jgi:hypothetical protein
LFVFLAEMVVQVDECSDEEIGGETIVGQIVLESLQHIVDAKGIVSFAFAAIQREEPSNGQGGLAEVEYFGTTEEKKDKRRKYVFIKKRGGAYLFEIVEEDIFS